MSTSMFESTGVEDIEDGFWGTSLEVRVLKSALIWFVECYEGKSSHLKEGLVACFHPIGV